jgi:hypothetical protein
MIAKKKKAAVEPKEVISIRVPAAIKTGLEKAAKADNRPMSNYLMQVIVRDLREKGLMK